MDTFKQDINSYLKRLKKGLNQTKKKMVSDTLFIVIGESPVRTGAYVESHRIGINKLDPSHAKPYLGPGFAPAMSEGSAMALKAAVMGDLRPLIETSKFSDTIFISNSIYYADKVEYIGWSSVDARHPYGKAFLKLKAKAKMYLASKTNAPLK